MVAERVNIYGPWSNLVYSMEDKVKVGDEVDSEIKNKERTKPLEFRCNGKYVMYIKTYL